jgi:hypothetical protein
MIERGGSRSVCTVRRGWRIHLVTILAYTLLALVLTWPMVARLATHVPGNGVDDPPLTWNLWWIRSAILELGKNPFDSDFLFYPLGINLAFYTLDLLDGLLSIPLQAAFGLIPASNLLLLSSYVLSGYGAFLLALYVLGAGGSGQGDDGQSRSRASPEVRAPGQALVDGRLLAAAFLAGVLYAFASNKLAYAALGQLPIASSQWIPFYVLFLFKTGDAPHRRRHALLAALFLLLQAYAELTYAAFLVLFTALWALCQAVSHRRPGSEGGIGPRLVSLVLIGTVFVLGLTPILWMMIPDLLTEGDFFVEGTGFAEVFSADLLGFLIPNELHPVFGGLVERFGFDHGVGQHIYLGYSVFALALLGAIRWWHGGDVRSTSPDTGSPGTGVRTSCSAKRSFQVRFWSLSALAFWLLVLGPTLRINGSDTGLPLPFALLAQLPFLKGNRYPSRYGVLLVLSLAVLVAFGLLALLQWSEKRLAEARRSGRLRGALTALIALLVALAVVFEHLSAPLPLSDMSVPPVYTTIAAEMPGDGTLLDLPVAWRNGFRVTGTQHPIIMFEQYYQSVHGKRILAGNISRNPPLKFQYFTEAPVINTLIALETGHQADLEVVERDRTLAHEVLRFFNIEAIVVHPEQAGPGIVPYIEAIMPVERIQADEETLAYRVELPPWPGQWTIVPGDELGRLSFAEGWGLPSGGVVWAQRPAARLLVPLNGESQLMTFRAYAPQPGQQITIEVNGREAGVVDMATGWMDYEVTLDGTNAMVPGLNEIWLRFGATYPAEQLQLSPRTIGETGVAAPVNLAVESAGQEVGDFGHILVDGREVSPNQRGYNVAVIHPETGAVEQTASFDTHLDDKASIDMARFLVSAPPGRIVAVAAADEVSRLLGQEAVDGLRGIGAAGDLRGKFRWGHAIVGVQGAPPGSALESLDWMRPVRAIVGEGMTEPRGAAAFSSIAFTARTDR